MTTDHPHVYFVILVWPWP